MCSLNHLNVLNDLNVWNIPELKACLRGETVSSCQLNNLESPHEKICAVQSPSPRVDFQRSGSGSGPVILLNSATTSGSRGASLTMR